MMDNEFKLYGKTLLPNKLPHEEPNAENIQQKIKENKVMLARWTTDFDCDKQTEWWYLIKDSKYDIAKLKSKYRCEINKGKRNFTTMIIDPKQYGEQIKDVFNMANESYSELSKCKKYDFVFVDTQIWIGAIDKETNKLAAYAMCKLKVNDGVSVLYLEVIKSNPEMKSKGVNAALMDFICDYYMNQKCISYIYDGERAIRHITNFQEYLTKYFGFRKAYCKLNIVYSKNMKILVNILYPFRKIIKKLENINRFVYNISCILYQEEIHRTFKR